MLAESLFQALGSFIFLGIILLLILQLILRIRSRRREEMLVRQWCDAKGYAINKIETTNTSIMATMLFWVAGWLLWWVASRRGWRLNVYDEEGGQKTVTLRVHRGGRIEETRF